ncbi:HAD-IA family hydrolase [Jannaschia ovalis]|uniref:HAD-IA family hydrolase n=1 Tax=Jannaschia ovalis TaxID=3038773 RepID=A0ABY8L8Y2_9RHOB|nr:HAD-IA family hydrolase [Jannaschia sp. GRR-S6-38]WGH77817.1 HAD-IA family hydrolase [Jannaschia sp. GRR-S6-38]
MTIDAVFFGSLGAIAEISEFQRRAYNFAFAEADLEWVWDRDSFHHMLKIPGGRARMANFAAATGDPVDTDALYSRALAHLRLILARQAPAPRPGVLDTIWAARAAGIRVVLISDAEPALVDIVIGGLAPHLGPDAFDWIGAGETVATPRPAPDRYARAIAAFALRPADAVAIEDTPEGAMSARAAGLDVLAFPGEAMRDRVFPLGVTVTCHLRPAAIGLDQPELAAE